MIYINEVLKNQEEEFIRDIQSEKLNIIFESVVITEEYRLENIQNNRMFLYIRTKKKSGAMHDCTVKLINGQKYKHGKDLGLELAVYNTKPYYEVWVGDSKDKKSIAKQLESQITNPEKKFIKKVITENYNDILNYWDLDLDNPYHLELAHEIEMRIYNKYRGIKNE